MLAACGGDDSGGSAGGTGGGGSGGGGNHKLNLFTWAEYHSQDNSTSFGNVTVTVYNSNEEAIAKLQASKGTSGFDVIIPTGAYIPQMAADDLIDHRSTRRSSTNVGNLDPIYLKQTWDPDNKYTVPKDWGSTGWIYDNSVITTPLETWNDFLDAATGRRADRRRCSTPLRTSPASTSGRTASTGRRPTRRISTRARTTS